MSRRVVITGLGTVNPLGNKVSAELMRLQELIRRTMQ